MVFFPNGGSPAEPHCSRPSREEWEANACLKYQSSPHLRDDLVIGVDIGGTKVAAGLAPPDGEILCHTRNPMVANDGASSALASVINAIETASAHALSTKGPHGLIRGVGICSPARSIPRPESS